MDTDKSIGYAEGEYVKILIPLSKKLRGWIGGDDIPPSCGMVMHRIDSLGVEGILVQTEKGNFLVDESMLRPLLRPVDQRRVG